MKDYSLKELIAEKKRVIQKRKTVVSEIVKLTFTIGIIALLLFVVFGFAVVDGNSMYPALRDGDLVMFYRLENSYTAGDIIAFHLDADGKNYVKRVVAREGDVVNIDNESGYLIVNGSVMTDEVLFPTTSSGDTISYPYKVPENCVFVMGDNREKSIDSRTFGAIDCGYIKGKLMLVLRTRIL